MKILILADYFSEASHGGAAGVALDDAHALAARGHQVSIVTIVNRKEDEGQITSGPFTIHRIRSSYSHRIRAYVSLYNPQVIGKLRRIIASVKPHVIHAHNVHTFISYYALKVARQSGAKVYITLHDVMTVHYGKFTEFIHVEDKRVPESFDFKIRARDLIGTFRKQYNPFRNRMIRHYLGYANRIFAVSEIQRQVLEANGITHVTVLHNGIDLQAWHVSDAEVARFKEQHQIGAAPAIFFSGWSTAAKGGEQLLRAFRLVLQKVSTAKLLAVGRTDYYFAELKKLASEWGIAEQIVFPGLLSGKELVAAYFCSSVIAFPSIAFETFGMVSLEGMASRKPVVGSCFGGARNVIEDGLTGYIINPYDIDTFAAKLGELLQSPELAERLGQAGYKRAEALFTEKKKIDALEGYYKND